MSYYSGWDARRVASDWSPRISPATTKIGRTSNKMKKTATSNKEGNTSSNVADEQAQISTNDGHDDIDLLAGDARGTTGTNKSSFYDVEGRMVPVSADTHYLH